MAAGRSPTIRLGISSAHLGNSIFIPQIGFIIGVFSNLEIRLFSVVIHGDERCLPSLLLPVQYLHLYEILALDLLLILYFAALETCGAVCVGIAYFETVVEI